jgi:DNA-binding MarR family transcriptional regulator
VPDEDLHAAVSAAVLRFIAGVVLYNQVVDQQMGLGGSDSQFLGLLALNGPMTPGRLAEMSGLTTGTVTGVIDRLEAGGFVRRERDPDDRRKVIVSPLPEGVARISEHYQEHGAHMESVLSRRDVGQLRVIADFLTDMANSPGGFISPPPESRAGQENGDAAG